MMRTSSRTVLALASTAALLGACHKNADKTASDNAATPSATAAAESSAAAPAPYGPGQTPAANAAQDSASVAVGGASAASLGSVNKDAFVSNAAQSDIYELGAARLAEQTSKNPKVKAFARRMIKDHTMTSEQMKPLASDANVALPKALDQRRQGLLDNLKSAGPDFDKVYANQQVAAHEEAVTLFDGYARRGDNEQLKAMAGKIAPKLHEHLDMAKALQAKVGGNGSAGK